MKDLDNIVSLLSRIRETQDGQDFIDYLKRLSKDNYEAFKKDPSGLNDVHKGYGIAIDSLIDSLEKSTERKNIPKEEQVGEWL